MPHLSLPVAIVELDVATAPRGERWDVFIYSVQRA